MNARDPFAFATLAAEQLIRSRPRSELPIDPFVIARDHQIEVVANSSRDAGVSGMLIRVGNAFAIGYATHIDNPAFQRFCVGHELGHYFLPGHPERVIGPLGVHESRRAARLTDRYEIEADRFSAGLLMPRHLFSPAVAQAGHGLAAIERLAERCGTSWHATAIRYAQCSPDPVAIIVSVGGRIDHCFMSDGLRARLGAPRPCLRGAVPRGTVTFAFTRNASNVKCAARADGTSNLRVWFGERDDLRLTEEVVGLGTYGRTLTVLHAMDLPRESKVRVATRMGLASMPAVLGRAQIEAIPASPG